MQSSRKENTCLWEIPTTCWLPKPVMYLDVKLEHNFYRHVFHNVHQYVYKLTSSPPTPRSVTHLLPTFVNDRIFYVLKHNFMILFVSYKILATHPVFSPTTCSLQKDNLHHEYMPFHDYRCFIQACSINTGEWATNITASPHFILSKLLHPGCSPTHWQRFHMTMIYGSSSTYVCFII